MFFFTKIRRIFVRQRILAVGFLLLLGFLSKQLGNNVKSIYNSSIAIADELGTHEIIGSSQGVHEARVQREVKICKQNDVNKTRQTGDLNLAPSKRHQNILLLSSMGRSGSSFLGGLLESLPGVFYFFEPFYNLQQWKLFSQDVAVRGLKELYTCNFTGLVYKSIKARGFKSIRHQYFTYCGSRNSCFEHSRLSRVCLRESIRLIKTIRTRVSSTLPLLEDQNLNLRVIHIVRDPRPSLISNWKEGWNVNTTRLCNDLLEDLKYGPKLRKMMPNRYIAVRYEDICANPWMFAEIIFQFLGYNTLPPSVVRFLNRSTSENSSPKNAYSLQRNSTEQQQKWRHDIKYKELTHIESFCSDAIRHLGYNLFGDIDTTRNLSFPLYNDSSSNTLFSYPDCIV